MSRASTPTIPFVLPLYEQLYANLSAASQNRTSIPLVIRQGATAGLEKLLKYKRIAENNQFYRLGTSTSKILYLLTFPHLLFVSFHTVLHPYLRSQWFRLTVSPDDRKGQEEAVQKAETLFRHVAETYFDTGINDASNPTSESESPAVDDAPKVTEPGPESDGNTWLKDLIKFEIPHTPLVAGNPRELFDEEVRRYLAFGGGCGSYEDNPLLWWKVCDFLFAAEPSR